MTENEKEKKKTADKTASLALTSTNTTPFYQNSVT